MPTDHHRAGSDAGARVLAGLLTVTGVAHFAVPGIYDPIVPHVLPGSARAWVLVSGAAELLCAAAIANKRSRPLGGTLAALLFVLVFPANIQMAHDWSHDGLLKAGVAWIRLPLQLPLIWWALRIRRASLERVQKSLDGAPG